MVKVRKILPRHDDQSINIEVWLKNLRLRQAPIPVLQQACALGRMTEDHLTFYGESCFALSLNMASLIAELNLDQETIAATIYYNSIEHGGLKHEDIADQTNASIMTLITGFIIEFVGNFVDIDCVTI